MEFYVSFTDYVNSKLIINLTIRYYYRMKFAQQPHTVFLVRPASFGFNVQTSASNVFQTRPAATVNVATRAIEEFDRMVDLLRAHEIDVRIFDDMPSPQKPDALFPNNWISTHEDGTVILYPMMTDNRRLERREDILEALEKDFDVTRRIDLSKEETSGKYLEGTGSLVFDHPRKLVFACRSPRTNPELVARVAAELGYTEIVFSAVDESGNPIYHTNVMMCVGEKFVVLCLDAIRDDHEQETLLNTFAENDLQVVAISFAQMRAFAGNMIELVSKAGDRVVVLSQTAFESLLPGQINAISKFADILPIRIDTIQSVGGGSVRCMVAGIHLPKRNRI